MMFLAGGVSGVLLALALSCGVLRSQVAPGVYHQCPITGSAHTEALRLLDSLKNRAEEPSRTDSTATLAALLKPGDDLARWDASDGATVTGYVLEVKPGGAESVNCGATALPYRDTHIVLVADSTITDARHGVIVEVTPRWRAAAKRRGADWSTAALRTLLRHRWATVHGWLFPDLEHTQSAENTNPGAAHNWRATVWEIHPVTSLEVH